RLLIAAEPSAEQRHRQRIQELPRAAVGNDAAGSPGGDVGAETTRAYAEPGRGTQLVPRTPQHALDPAIETLETSGLEERLAGAVGPDPPADPLQPPQRLLPGPLGSLGIRGDQGELRAARERLAHPHPGSQAELLRRRRDLPDQLGSAGLRCEGGRPR